MILKLIGFILCPFVQRAVITLREKNVDYAVEFIDLDDPPGWFKHLSPLGKVPILQVDGEVVFESSVILDYLDDVHAPRLHPADPLRRAHHKAWIEYGSGLLMDQVAICKAVDEAEYALKLDNFRNGLERLSEPLQSGLFAGDGDFSLLDAAYAPLFVRMELLRRLRADLSGLYPPGVESWARRLLNRSSVTASVVADFEPRFIDYFAAKASWLMRSIKG